MVKVIVIKIGNSFALRVPKQYIDDNKLKLGDEVQIDDPLSNQQASLAALIAHGQKHGPVKGVPDPVAWQRAQRSWAPRIKKINREF